MTDSNRLVWRRFGREWFAGPFGVVCLPQRVSRPWMLARDSADTGERFETAKLGLSRAEFLWSREQGL